MHNRLSDIKRRLYEPPTPTAVLQGYSTLGSQWLMKGYAHNPVLTHPAVLRVASAAKRSPAQVVLRWALQQGQVSTAPQQCFVSCQ